MRIGVDTLGNLLAVNERERAQVGFVDRGYTGDAAADRAKAHGIQLEVVKHTEPKKGFVLSPRRSRVHNRL